MKTCTGAEQETCNVEKMGCGGCYYDNKADEDLVVQMEITKFIKSLVSGAISIDYSPITMQYEFKDKNGNTIEVEPAVYLKLVNYIEKGEIYD